MDVLRLFVNSINWVDILFSVQCLIWAHLIWYLHGTLVLIWEERESKTDVGRLRMAITGKTLQIRWEIVFRKLVKWAIIFISFVFYREIVDFIGIGKFLIK